MPNKAGMHWKNQKTAGIWGEFYVIFYIAPVKKKIYFHVMPEIF